jgi:predicted transcriptional regulator
MAATRENVLAAIVQFVESNKRRAPAKEIASIVSDTVPNVQGIIKALVSEGAITSSRGRNGGALPDGVVLEKKVKQPEKQAAASEDDTSSKFAALLAQLDATEAVAVEGQTDLPEAASL